MIILLIIVFWLICSVLAFIAALLGPIAILSMILFDPQDLKCGLKYDLKSEFDEEGNKL